MLSHTTTSSPTKRSALGPSAFTNLQQDAFQKAPSPPRTPHSSKPRSARPNPTFQRATIRPVLRETFLEDNTPVDPTITQETDCDLEDKDVHDLSLSSKHVPRLSMFDNMLLSLDRLSDGRSDLNDPAASTSKRTAFNSDIDIRSRYNTLTTSRHRGHTMSSSVSSENDVRKENIQPSAARSSGRIGRSNSNSNFSKGSKKLPSIFGEDEPSTRTRVFLAQRAVHPSERSRQKHTGHSHTSSKSSASSSIDLEQMIAGPPPGKAGAGNRRSRSFDYGSNRHIVPSFKEINQIEAAPTPIIHAGPAARQLPLPASPQPTPLVRKNSTKSSKSHHGRKDRSATLGAASSKAKAEHSTDSWTNFEALPPLPTHIGSPGLSSTFIESKTTTTLRERPGFFRRMFGSGKNAPPSASIRGLSDASQHDGPGSLDGERPDVLDYDHLQNPVSRLPKQVQKQPASPNVSTMKATPPTVTKKSSTFFRRRKKSAPENIPLPLPLNLQDLKDNTGKPSPISSLRQVMDPYLAEARQSISSVQSNGIIDAPQGYHTALSSPVGPQDAFSKAEGILGVSSEASERRARPGALPSLHIPGSKYNSSLRVPTGDHNLVSFLSDSSSTELSTKSSNTSPRPRAERPKTSPTNAHHSERSSRSRPDPPLSRNSSWKNEDVNVTSSVVSTATSVLSGSLFSPATKSGQLSPEQMELDEGPVTSAKVSSPLQATMPSPQASGSELSVYRSAPSTPVIVPRDSSHADKLHSPLSQVFNVSAKDHGGSLSEEERERALMIFENRHDEIEPGTAAAWLGDAGTDRERIRTAYMEVFDWTNLDILTGMRGLCDRLALKGETQQVDRILDSFSKRWCECNPNHGFKSPDVVHTICYSILLLNTDLHVAEIGQKMTKNQFVRNALPTIKSIASNGEPVISGTLRPSSLSKRHLGLPLEECVRMSEDQNSWPGHGQVRPPIERQNSEEPVDFDTGSSEIGPLVSAPFVGSERGWDSQVENVLKSFYTSVARQRLPLFGAVGETTVSPQASNNFLSITGNVLKRTPSTLSKNHAETLRGRTTDFRSTTSRWTSKARSRPRLYPAVMGSSSRTSLDDQSTGWSPGISSTWSKASLNKTLTSMSVDSFGSTLPRGEYQKSIGFASALSQAYMRDELLDVDSLDDNMRTDTLLEDESLGLCGAPWAKEGILKHKCHLDSIDKKSKDRNWTDCFAVIEKGWMRLFSFSVNTKSLRHKAKEQPKTAGGVVGGGNWQDNAEELWKFLLRQTIASALPPPGYAKSRPYVWALSLPNGAVHLFQVGTPDIVKEFVSTANYWSARLSKEPMLGGISNMEYGWSDSVINRALVGSDSQVNMPAANGRPSTQSSIRTSIDRASVRPRLPGDKLHINDWSPPQQNTVASQLMEVDQLKALQTYVKNVEEELQKHNELRPAMLLAFSQRHPNSNKAMANWEKKSSYLLREIIKFQTYIDSLQAANIQKEKIYAMRKEDENGAKDDHPQTAGSLSVVR